MEAGNKHYRRTVNIKDAARELGLSIPTAYQLAHRDELPVPTIRAGRRLFVSREALDELFRSSKEKASAEIAA